MIFDAKAQIMGRVASQAAARALAGDTVVIVNCADAVLAGRPKHTIKTAKQRQENKVVGQGPYTPKTPAGLMRRAVRGMLPFKKPRGREAYARVKCYDQMPEGLKGEPVKLGKQIAASKLTTLKCITLREVCKTVSGSKGGAP